MYIKGASRRSVGFWEKHLQDTIENTRAEIIETRGLAADDLRGMMLEMQEDARFTRCKNFMYIASFNPCAHEHLTEKQWGQVFEIFEKHRGIPAGQQRIVIEHEKEGRTHRHVVWNRVDLENMRAFPDGLDVEACDAAEKEIERTLGLERTPSFLDREEGAPPLPQNPKSYEMYRGMKSGLDARDITAEITALYRESEHAADFVEGLHQHGYELVKGKRAFCVLDGAGHEHSLVRRLDGVNTKELREFMQGMDLTGLPTIEQARARYRESQQAERLADLETVQQEIAWEEALAKAAIAVEKIDERFIAPEDHVKEAQARDSREKAQEFQREDAAQKEGVIRLYRGTGNNVWAADHGDALFFSTDPSRAAAFGKLHYVDVTVAEMANFERPHSQRILEQEPVARNDWRTADPTIIARLKPLEGGFKNRQEIPDGARQEHEAPAPELGKTAREIRLAYSLTQTGQEFANALEDHGFILARVTDADAERLNRWERQRLKEEGQTLDAGQTVKAEGPWMAQRGGVDELTPELKDSAERSYEKWTGDKSRYNLASYVSYAQRKDEERAQAGQGKNKPEYQRYRPGEMVVVNQFGHIVQLTHANTGDGLKARTDHLKDIDRTPLLSVTTAEGVMKSVRQHRQEERTHATEQKREESARATAENLWPTKPPQPDRNHWTLFEQAAHEAGRDSRTENLHGVAAQVWDLWSKIETAKLDRAAEGQQKGRSTSVKTNAKEFAAALDEQGISFARVTKDEAERSRKESDFARAVGNYAPRFKEAEIVIVTEQRSDRRREGQIIEPPRVHKLDPSLAEKFVKTLDSKTPLLSVEATLKASNTRAEQRGEERSILASERAADIKDRSREAGKGPRKAPAPSAGKAAARSVGKVFDVAASAFESLLSPKLTPEQIRQGEIAERQRQLDGDHAVDFSNYTASRSVEQQQLDNEREAERRRNQETGRER